MSFAESNRVKVLVALETTWAPFTNSLLGTLGMRELRLTSEGLEHSVNTVQSQQIRADRMQSSRRKVGGAAAGPIACELHFGGLDELWEGLFQDAIASTTIADSSVTLASTSVTFPDANSAAVTAMRVGAFVRVGSHGIFRIASKGTTSLKLEGSTIASVGVASTNVTHRNFRNGTTAKSLIVEKVFEDIGNKRLVFEGQRVDNAAVNFRPNEIATVTFQLSGKRGVRTSATLASAITSANTTDVLNAADELTAIFEGGFSSPLTASLTQFNFTMSNNTRIQSKLSSEFAAGIGLGSVGITGTAEMYFEDYTHYVKYEDNTATNYACQFVDSAGNVMVFQATRVRYTSGSPVAQGLNNDITLSLGFAGEYDSTTNSMVMLDLLPAV